MYGNTYTSRRVLSAKNLGKVKKTPPPPQKKVAFMAGKQGTPIGAYAGVPCLECEAPVGWACRSKSGTARAPHKSRLTGAPPPIQPDLCPKPRVACWLGCVKVKPNCQFCGVCADPDCELPHSMKRRTA